MSVRSTRLPLNCTVDYFPEFLSPEEATVLYDLLLNEYNLANARLKILAGGVLTETDSFKILFASNELLAKNHYPEEVHGKSFPWRGLMASLRQRVEELTQKSFEVAMCLYYPDGNYFAAYHSDHRTSGYQTVIPSISLGAVREFCFKEKESAEVAYSLNLAHGSLLLMGEYCQDRYVHGLPQDPTYRQGRINITFREPGFS